MAEKLLKYGFQITDLPYDPPFADGKCYFAGLNSRNLADEYNAYYKQGILEVTMNRVAYYKFFKRLEKFYQGGSNIELAIPHSLFTVLNQFPRVLKSQ